MAVGVIWVIFRVIVHVRVERKRERQMSTDLMLDDQFKDYLKELTAVDASPTDLPTQNSDQEEESKN